MERGRIRRAGTGRPSIEQSQPGIKRALEKLVDPLTRGDPESPSRWTCKSRAKLSAALSKADDFLQRRQPVVSVDTKKKELVGDFKNGGQEWQRKGSPEKSLVHDFPQDSAGKAIPYGIYDMGRNEAWVNVGRDHDTPAFAVASLRRWWNEMGKRRYPEAGELFITADVVGAHAMAVHGVLIH